MTKSNSLAVETRFGTAVARDWFLINSRWQDSVWHFRPTNVLEESVPVRVRWDFEMPGGGRFDDGGHAALCESARQLIALIRGNSLRGDRAQRATTSEGYFHYLRQLVKWMTVIGITRFADIDAQSLQQFHSYLRGRPGVARENLSPATIQKYFFLFTYLYKFRDQLDDGLGFDPFRGISTAQAAHLRESDIRRWPYTPDAVSVALVGGSIDLLEHGHTILRARVMYSQAIAAAARRNWDPDARTAAATLALETADISLPRLKHRILSVKDLADAVDMLYAACFVVISYLVGPRASEILHLCASCVKRCGETDSTICMVQGAIFKRQPEYHGRPHEWVAPPAAVQAIEMLEALSAGHRKRAHSSNLWLRRSYVHGAVEWQSDCSAPLAIPSTERVRGWLQRLAVFLEVPEHNGRRWKFGTHQGRKTFARFAALRDRTALLAVAQHFGHRDRAATDAGYAGSDYRLNEEIDAEIMEQSVLAWEHMLASPGLGGRAGVEIIAKRPRFRGARMKQDLKAYARLMVDSGLVMGVCDWGYCVYREQTSACLGNAAGPNPANREPSACSRCANFAVSEKHRPYWVDQAARCEAMLNEPALPLQTIRIARERVAEARRLLRAIDAKVNESEHEASSND